MECIQNEKNLRHRYGIISNRCPGRLLNFAHRWGGGGGGGAFIRGGGGGGDY